MLKQCDHFNFQRTGCTIAEDTPILKHEVFLVRLPIDISLVSTTGATNGPGTDGEASFPNIQSNRGGFYAPFPGLSDAIF